MTSLQILTHPHMVNLFWKGKVHLKENAENDSYYIGFQGQKDSLDETLHSNKRYRLYLVHLF